MYMHYKITITKFRLTFFYKFIIRYLANLCIFHIFHTMECTNNQIFYLKGLKGNTFHVILNLFDYNKEIFKCNYLIKVKMT